MKANRLSATMQFILLVVMITQLLLKSMLPLLNDPIKSIRMEAAFKLSALPKESIPKEKQIVLKNVIKNILKL